MILKALKNAGHDVRCHWSTEEHIKLGDFTPEAVIISLDRLPSHGRAVAEWLWEARKRQGIPILFAGGTADKVEATRAKFPNAMFCSSDDVLSVLTKVLA